MPKIAPPPTASATIALSPLRSWWLLSSAIRFGDDEELEALLREGADPNARQPDSDPKALSPAPLHLACLSGSPRAVRALIAAGARPDALFRAQSPWVGPQTSQSAAMAVAEFLFKFSGSRPLAPHQGVEKMQALIDGGLSPLARTGRKRSVWSDLLMCQELPVGAYLPWIRAGAPVDQLDDYDRSLLLRAVCAQDIQGAIALLELGADPSLPCCAGRMTPAAASASYPKAVHAPLLERFNAIAEARALAQDLPCAPRRPGAAL